MESRSGIGYLHNLFGSHFPLLLPPSSKLPKFSTISLSPVHTPLRPQNASSFSIPLSPTARVQSSLNPGDHEDEDDAFASWLREDMWLPKPTKSSEKTAQFARFIFFPPLIANLNQDVAEIRITQLTSSNKPWWIIMTKTFLTFIISSTSRNCPDSVLSDDAFKRKWKAFRSTTLWKYCSR